MFRHPLFRLPNLLYLLALQVALSVVAAYTLTDLSGVSLIYTLTDSFINGIVLSILMLAAGNTLYYYYPTKYVILVLVGISLAISFVWLALTDFMVGILYSEEVIEAISEYNVFRWGGAMGILLGFFQFTWFHAKLSEVESKLQRQEEVDQMVKEAELNRLRQQLQPHFLFNSLNSILSLTKTDTKAAGNMLITLSDFYRKVLKNDTQKLIPLCEEIEQIELYFELEKIRFGHRLKTNIVCEQEAIHCVLPSLILQPLMENAIKHGLYAITGLVEINLTAKKMADKLLIELSNPFQRIENEQPKGIGFGLNAVAKRLILLYGRHDLLKIHTDLHIYTVQLSIPQNDQNHLN